MISDHTSPPPPTITQDATRPWADLPPNQEEMYEKVLAHFAKEGYSIPGVEEGKGELMDEEKLWLVSIIFHSCSVSTGRQMWL